MGTITANTPATAPVGALQGPRYSHKRILLVEDEQAVRQAIALLLGLDQHIVVEAASGMEALTLFKTSQFDLVITDFQMPQMKGNELAARIKQVSPAQPVLMITAYAEQLGPANHPVDALLDKPFSIRDLRAVMSQLLP